MPAFPTSLLIAEFSIQNPPPAPTSARERAVQVVFLVIFVFGVYAILRIAWTTVRGVHFGLNPVQGFGALIKLAGDFMKDEAGIWITAIATYFLARATMALERGTRIEHARNGPFLSFSTRLEPRTRSLDAEYLPQWVSDDDQDAAFQSRAAGKPFDYVVLRINNQQTSPHGVATAVNVHVAFLYGAADDVAEHPYFVSRLISSPAILASTHLESPVFRAPVGLNFVVRVTKVEYEDILNRKRSAAVGTGWFRRDTSGNFGYLGQVFDPRKGEYTDAE